LAYPGKEGKAPRAEADIAGSGGTGTKKGGNGGVGQA